MRSAFVVCLLGSLACYASTQTTSTSLSIAAQYLHSLSHRHVYGKVYIRGHHKGIEYYRATFGGLIPCGSRDIVGAPGNGCDESSYPADLVTGRYVTVGRGTCTFVTKALLAQRAGAAGLIFINHEPGLLRPPMGNVTDANEVVIPVVLAHKSLANITADAEARRPVDGLPNVHGSLGPNRESCVDPQAADEEWFKAMANDTLPRSAHPLARVRPGGVPTGASNIREELLATRMPGTWPAAPTEAAVLTLSAPLATHASLVHPEAEGRLSGLTRTQYETYLSLFGTPVLGEPRPLSFPKPSSGCVPPASPILNGSLAVVTRGSCSMIDKARVMQEAGAAGLVIVNANTGQGDGQPVGIVQAIADDDVETRPVLIPAGMVSAQDAANWIWTAQDGSAADLTGVTATWTASRASGGAWDELTELRAKGEDGWPSDGYHRRQQLLTLILAHHPSSSTGHGSRWEYLLQTVQLVGLGEELDRTLASVQWQEDGTGVVMGQYDTTWTRGAGEAAPGVAIGYPGQLFLLAGLRGSVMERVQDGPLRCRSQSGSQYTVSLPGPVDPSSPYPLTRRIQQLLATQACLEKTALLNAAALGGYLDLLRRETEARDWPEMLRTLIGRPYGMTDTEAVVAAATYIDMGRAVREVLGAQDVDQATMQSLLGATKASNSTEVALDGVANQQ